MLQVVVSYRRWSGETWTVVVGAGESFGNSALVLGAALPTPGLTALTGMQWAKTISKVNVMCLHAKDFHAGA
jgi:hypothetical protein